jgi:hypothetical protein
MKESHYCLLCKNKIKNDSQKDRRKIYYTQRWQKPGTNERPNCNSGNAKDKQAKQPTAVYAAKLPTSVHLTTTLRAPT